MLGCISVFQITKWMCNMGGRGLLRILYTNFMLQCVTQFNFLLKNSVFSGSRIHS